MFCQFIVDEYGVLIYNLFYMLDILICDIEGVIILLVVFLFVYVMEMMCEKYVGKKLMIVGFGIKIGLNLRYENLCEVGVDCIVNVVVVVEKYGGLFVVVDFGIVMIFDCIDEKGNYFGGVIVLGIYIVIEVFYEWVFKLFCIELEKFKKVIGCNMVYVMQVGIIYGYVGQVDGIVDCICIEMGVQFKVIVIGGFVLLIVEEICSIEEVDLLFMLEGLCIIYEWNWER